MMIFYPGWYLKRVRMLFSKITLILLFPNRVTIMESMDYSQGLFLNLCVSLFCWRERTRAVCNRLPLNFWWLRATEAWLEKNSTKTIARSIDLQTTGEFMSKHRTQGAVKTRCLASWNAFVCWSAQMNCCFRWVRSWRGWTTLLRCGQNLTNTLWYQENDV